MTERDYAPLSTACVRALIDKQYDKRRAAASEIEKMVKDFNSNKSISQIKKLLNTLAKDFATSHNPNYRKGGLIGLAAVAIALGKDAGDYTEALLLPIMGNLSDSDSRVRYYASESLYNVVKVVRSAVLPYFNDIFSGLSKLATDPDQSVKTGSELLDRLLKDIVTESATFDLVGFMPALRERLYTNDSFARQFIISWLSCLDAVPDINLIVFLPEILDGLFCMLNDPTVEIQRMCGTVLDEFLRSIRKDPSQADFKKMINILINHAQAPNDTLKYTAIVWIRDFIQLSKEDMLPYTSGILIAILPCLSFEGENRKNIKEIVKTVNNDLMLLVTKEASPNGSLCEESVDEETIKSRINLSSVLDVITNQLINVSVPTKVAAVKWIYHLHASMSRLMMSQVDLVFPVLLKVLADPSDEVVQHVLHVIAQIVSSEMEAPEAQTGDPSGDQNEQSSVYLMKFISSLIILFRHDPQLLEERGQFIIRQLCILLNPEDIFKKMANILCSEEDYKFARVMIETMNTILLTSPELFELRKSLKNEENVSLFRALYVAWCHNPVATVSLCLLTQNYHHTCQLIETLADYEITVEFLTEVDRLIQLLESPIFIHLRLQLLEAPYNYFLLRAMYGLLMMLPQTEAFHTLRHRLESVPKIESVLKGMDFPRTNRNDQVFTNKYQMDFAELKDIFVKVQESHKSRRAATRNEILSKMVKNISM